MKKGILVLVCLATALSAWSLNYCQASAFGYGAAATGGGSATPTTITSLSAIKSSNKVYVITQDITVSKLVKISKLNNITILGMPGVKLISNQQNKDNSGILTFSGCSNVIIRNLTFEGPGAYDCDGNDLLCFDGVTKAWVDHCDFQDGCDGNFDNKGNTDNVTVSWCRFRYLKTPKSGGSGGANDHRFTNLLGADDNDKPADGTYNMTWAYCWWDNGCKQRMVRGRNASLHFLNCYWNSSVADYYIGPQNLDAYVEGCYVEGKPGKDKFFYQNYKGNNGLKCVDSYFKNGTPSNVTKRSVVTPTYSYEAVSYTEAKTMVTNTTCGAGATLTVTKEGAVSSACDEGGDTPDPGPTPPTPPTPAGEHSFTWNISDPTFAAIAGSITSTTTVDGLTIVAKSDGALTLDEQEAKYGFAEGDTVVFVNRLKTGGSGKADCRHIKFSVTGTCTIEVWAKSSNSSEDRTINIYTNSLDSKNLIGTLPALGGELVKQSFTYTGGPTTIVMGSASSGVNFYAINIVYPSPTEIAPATNTQLPHKLIRRGQLFILHQGRYYDLTGNH